MRPSVKEEFYVVGPWLVIKNFENEYVTGTIVHELPQRLLAFDDLSPSNSIIDLNWRRRSGAQKPYSHPLGKKKIQKQKM